MLVNAVDERPVQVEQKSRFVAFHGRLPAQNKVTNFSGDTLSAPGAGGTAHAACGRVREIPLTYVHAAIMPCRSLVALADSSTPEGRAMIWGEKAHKASLASSQMKFPVVSCR